MVKGLSLLVGWRSVGSAVVGHGMDGGRRVQFLLRNGDPLVNGALGRQVNVQDSKFQVFLAVRAKHGPEGSSLFAAITGRPLGVAITLLKGSGLGKLWSR